MREMESVKCNEENKEKINLQIAKILNNIGCVYFEYGELRDAKDTYEEALDIQRDNLCSKDPDDPAYLAMASTLCNLGENYFNYFLAIQFSMFESSLLFVKLDL